MWKGDELSPARVADDVTNGLFYVAECDGEIAGTIKFQLEDTCSGGRSQADPRPLSGLVRRRFAGGGVSSAMLRWAVERARLLAAGICASTAKLRASASQSSQQFGFRHHSDRHVGPYFVSRYEYESSQSLTMCLSIRSQSFRFERAPRQIG
jgi:hypothetical protein